MNAAKKKREHHTVRATWVLARATRRTLLAAKGEIGTLWCACLRLSVRTILKLYLWCSARGACLCRNPHRTAKEGEVSHDNLYRTTIKA